MRFIYSQHRNHRSGLIVGVLWIYQVLAIANWRCFFLLLCFKMSGILYADQVSKMTGMVSKKQVCTLHLRNFEPCNVNIFHVFLRKIEKWIIGGPIRASKNNICWGEGYLGPKRTFLLPQYGLVVRLFVYRSNVFIKRCSEKMQKV